jgi:hypothetical protein
METQQYVPFCCWRRRSCNSILCSVAMELQEWAPFALLSSYKIFRTAINNNEYWILWVCVCVCVSVCLCLYCCLGYLSGMHIASFLRCVISSSVACILYHILPHNLTDGTIFEEKKMLNIKYVWFSFFSLRRIQPDINSNRPSCKVLVILVRF